MNRQVVSGGAIACSAMMIYGWAQGATPGSNLKACGDELAKTVSSWLSRKAIEQAPQHCSYQRLLPKLANAPQLFHALKWSRTSSNVLPDDMEAVYSKLLKQAQASAKQNHLANAIAMVAGIPNNSLHHATAQQLQDDWSQELLRRAADRYQKADVSTALSMLKAIPLSSQRHQRANELQQRWKQEAILFQQAKVAKHQQDWKGVIDALKPLEGTSLYQSPPAQELLQQAISKLFASDASLLQLAGNSSAKSSVGTTQAVYDALNLSSRSANSAFAESMSKPSNLAIDLNQALEWAQPSSSIKASDVPKKVPMTSKPGISVPPSAMKPVVTPPELLLHSPN